MKDRLQDILDRVKDPENGMSVSQMNLVAGIKYKKETRLFEVYLYPQQGAKACCVIIQLNAYSTMQRLIQEEILNEFPQTRVLFKTV